MAIGADRGHYCSSCRGHAHGHASGDAHGQAHGQAHGHGHDGAPAVPAARTPLDDDREAAWALDEMCEEERWLWRLVVEADRIAAAAPPTPDPDRLCEAQRRDEA